MSRTESRRQWITKGDKPEYVRKETDNNPGAPVSVDQLKSSKPVLVPQFSVKLKSARILAAQIMVEHFGKLNLFSNN